MCCLSSIVCERKQISSFEQLRPFILHVARVLAFKPDEVIDAMVHDPRFLIDSAVRVALFARISGLIFGFSDTDAKTEDSETSFGVYRRWIFPNTGVVWMIHGFAIYDVVAPRNR